MKNDIITMTKFIHESIEYLSYRRTTFIFVVFWFKLYIKNKLWIFKLFFVKFLYLKTCDYSIKYKIFIVKYILKKSYNKKIWVKNQFLKIFIKSSE